MAPSIGDKCLDTKFQVSRFSGFHYPDRSLWASAIGKVRVLIGRDVINSQSDLLPFMLIGNSRQLAKIENLTLSLPDNVYVKPVSSARNLGVIFDSRLSFTDHVSSVSKACYCHIRNLRRIRSSLDQSTATTIATSMIHSKLDYCNSLFLNLPKFELNRLQSILNSAARAITNTSKFSKITPVLKSLHWLLKSLNVFTLKFFLLLILHYSLTNHRTWEVFSLRKTKLILDLPRQFLWFVHPTLLLFLSLTDHSPSQHLFFWTSCQPTCVLSLLTTVLLYLFLPLSFTKVSKLTSSTYASRHRHLLPIWTAFNDFWPGSILTLFGSS